MISIQANQLILCLGNFRRIWDQNTGKNCLNFQSDGAIVASLNNKSCIVLIAYKVKVTVETIRKMKIRLYLTGGLTCNLFPFEVTERKESR